MLEEVRTILRTCGEMVEEGAEDTQAGIKVIVVREGPAH